MGDAAVKSFLGSCVQLLQALMEVSSSSFLPSYPFYSSVRTDQTVDAWVEACLKLLWIFQEWLTNYGLK